MSQGERPEGNVRISMSPTIASPCGVMVHQSQTSWHSTGAIIRLRAAALCVMTVFFGLIDFLTNRRWYQSVFPR